MLTTVHVDLGVGEIRQATGAVEVQMRQDDMLDGLARDAQAGKLPRGHWAQIRLQAEIQCKEANPPGRRLMVVHAHAGVDQDQPLIGLHHQTGSPDLPAGEPGGHGCAVRNADGHIPELGAEPHPYGGYPSGGRGPIVFARL